MTIQILKQLLDAVQERMPEVKPPADKVGAISIWARPPLVSGVRLGDVEIDDANKVTSRLATSDMVDAYEEFIHGYYLGKDLAHRRPYEWIRRNLGMTALDARRIAPVKLNIGRRTRDEDWLTILLWIIHTCTKGSTLWSTDKLMIVTLEDKRIGFEEGVLLSSYTPGGTLAHVPDFHAILTQPSMGTRGSCRQSGLNKYYLIAGQQPGGKALQLALRALYWRMGDPYRLERRLFSQGSDQEGKVLLEGLRTGLLTTNKPRRFLYDSLVPRYTNIEDFISCFGSPFRARESKPKDGTVEAWLQIIESILIMRDGE